MGRGVSGGGGHSSGGRSGSFSHSSGGRMNSGSGRGSGSSAGRGRPPGGGFNSGPRFGGGFYGGPVRGGFYGGPVRGGYRGGFGCGSGCLTVFIILIVIVVLLSVFSEMSGMFSTVGITQSTVERTRLDKQYTTSTVYYVDELDWIRNSTTVNNGLKSFYEETGVHPLLYITDTVNGTMDPSSSDMEQYSEELYNELCPDEGHILFLFHCLDGGTDYSMWYTCGAQAKTVMDEEACNILMDYIDAYFVSNKSDDEMFADAFRDAGKRIMNKTTSPLVYLIVFAGVIIILLIAFSWWKKIKAQKNLEAKQTEEMLNKELHTFSETDGSDPDLTDLENKYK
ncbi:MAG: hypothetical protein ACI38A_08860 [Candidatus Ornithomonoglobus sp.]